MAADGMNDTMCLDRGMFHAMMQTLPPPLRQQAFCSLLPTESLN